MSLRLYRLSYLAQNEPCSIHCTQNVPVGGSRADFIRADFRFSDHVFQIPYPLLSVSLFLSVSLSLSSVSISFSVSLSLSLFLSLSLSPSVSLCVSISLLSLCLSPLSPLSLSLSLSLYLSIYVQSESASKDDKARRVSRHLARRDPVSRQLVLINTL